MTLAVRMRRTAKANGHAVRTASLATYEYEPYGDAYYNSGIALNVGFTGHQWDANMGPYFAPYRWYNPSAARWLTRDPLGMVDGPNVYEYGLLNPATYADRDGRIVTVLVGFLAALLAGCGLYSFIGADNGPQGDSTQHCVFGCKLGKCLGCLGNHGDLARLINRIWEWAGGRVEPDSTNDDNAAQFGAATCSKDCASCEDCCSDYYPPHPNG